jgi:hypothetical protein
MLSLALVYQCITNWQEVATFEFTPSDDGRCERFAENLGTAAKGFTFGRIKGQWDGREGALAADEMRQCQGYAIAVGHALDAAAN